MWKYLKITLLISVVVCLGKTGYGQDGFRVWPYLQNPARDAMTISWFSEDSIPGRCTLIRQSGEEPVEFISEPVPAFALDYPEWEETSFFDGQAPGYPFRHRVRPEGLEPGTSYNYSVDQGVDRFTSTFRTAPKAEASFKFVVFADSETEPESKGIPTYWSDPITGNVRPYLVDQTTGFANNLEVIRSSEPDLVVIAGDLVMSGGEQRDWDEFWRHQINMEGGYNLAGHVPFLTAPGNHEYYESYFMDRYNQPGSERAISKYLTYFESPSNQSELTGHRGRYYSIDYGPVTFIMLDANNNKPESTEFDTNHLMLGESAPNGGNAPDFGPGSPQYAWLEEQLKWSQYSAHFTFVVLHHAPYSSGPHGRPPGTGVGEDDLSGIPVRQLTPLFMKYGVDAVFSGHDEMWERSEIDGMRTGPSGENIPHTIQFYDVGVGGDGLRGPWEGAINPFQKFLAHSHATEVWEDSTLVSGGKHYGHLEVEIDPGEGDEWMVTLTPVYVLPIKETPGPEYTGFERHIYNDQIVISRIRDTTYTGTPYHPTTGQEQRGSLLCNIHPNPFRESIRIGYELPEPCRVSLEVYDLSGNQLIQLVREHEASGFFEFTWDGLDRKGKGVKPGVYFARMKTSSGRVSTMKLVRF